MGLNNTPAFAQVLTTTNLSREDVWQIVASTNALNRDIGLPRVKYAEPTEQNGTILRHAEAKVGFIKLQWAEYPFEWVQPKWHGVVREFYGSPIYKIFAGIELTGGENGEPTTAKIVTYVWARSLPLKPLAILIAKTSVRRVAKHFEKMFKLAQTSFPRPQKKKMDSSVDHQKLATKMSVLLADKRARPDIAQVLENHLRRGADDEVLMMQPYKLADAWGQDRIAVLKVFLSATKAGLLELQWALTCPGCKIPKRTSSSLRDIEAHFNCDFCDVDYTSSFDENLELRFSVHQNIRKAVKGEFCIGSPALFPHILSQVVVPPMAEKTVVLPASHDGLRLRRLRRKMQVTMEQAPQSEAIRNDTDLVIADNAMTASSLLYHPNAPLTVRLKNTTEQATVISIEDSSFINYMVTALKLMTIPQFMNDFANEVIATGSALSVKQICLLFTDLKGSTQTYEVLGDAKAFAAISKHFDFLNDIIAEHEGRIVKTIGDAVMAVFVDPQQALEAVVEFQERLPHFNEDNKFDRPLVLKAGLHVGPAIAINANGVNDFFGKTVNLAVRLQEASRGNDCILSDTMRDELTKLTPTQRQKFSLESEEIDAKGFTGKFTIQRMLFHQSKIERSA